MRQLSRNTNPQNSEVETSIIHMLRTWPKGLELCLRHSDHSKSKQLTCLRIHLQRVRGCHQRVIQKHQTIALCMKFGSQHVDWTCPLRVRGGHANTRPFGHVVEQKPWINQDQRKAEFVERALLDNFNSNSFKSQMLSLGWVAQSSKSEREKALLSPGANKCIPAAHLHRSMYLATNKIRDKSMGSRYVFFKRVGTSGNRSERQDCGVWLL